MAAYGEFSLQTAMPADEQDLAARGRLNGENDLDAQRRRQSDHGSSIWPLVSRGRHPEGGQVTQLNKHFS